MGKPKIVLDQLKEGLSTWGFGKDMKKYPDIFKPLFVHGEVQLSSADVVKAFRFPASVMQKRAHIITLKVIC